SGRVPGPSRRRPPGAGRRSRPSGRPGPGARRPRRRRHPSRRRPGAPAHTSTSPAANTTRIPAASPALRISSGGAEGRTGVDVAPVAPACAPSPAGLLLLGGGGLLGRRGGLLGGLGLLGRGRGRLAALEALDPTGRVHHLLLTGVE